jgi:hypothetical protein
MRIQLERFSALAVATLAAAGWLAGCSGTSGGDEGSGGVTWLTSAGGSAARGGSAGTPTGGVATTAGAGGAATGGETGTAGAATGGAATGGTGTGGTGAANCLGDTPQGTVPSCNSLAYSGVVCSGNVAPEGYSICNDYETPGITRAGVMEDLIDCLGVLPDDAAGACNLQHDAAWACVASVEQQACSVPESASLCDDINQVCSNITLANCEVAFNTLTSVGRTAAHLCMMGVADCTSAWDSCFPSPI